MKANELVAMLSRRGVVLSVVDDRLRVNAPTGVITPELREGLTRSKPEIIALLISADPGSESNGLEERSLPRFKEVPVSIAQEGLWFLDAMMQGSAISNMNVALRLRGLLDIDALQRSLNEVVKRHQTLRTRFAIRQNRLVQVIDSDSSIALTHIDLQHLPDARRKDEAISLATREAQTPFDLANGPLLRPVLIQLCENDRVLLLTIHHIAADGWSLGVLCAEMLLLYSAYAVGGNVALPQLKVQYSDYALWQRERLRGERLQMLVSYWKQRLEGAPPLLKLCTDRPRPNLMTFHGAHKYFQIPGELTDSLKTFGRANGATLFVILLTAYQILLHHCSGQTDILVGNNVANRDRVELEGLIGVFVNTLVIRVDLSNSPTFREALRKAREAVLESYQHQELPFEMLVQELRPPRDLSHGPIVQAGFAMHNMPVPEFSIADLSVELIETETGTARTDIVVFMRENRDGIRGTVEYNTDLFDSSTIERMISDFNMLLERMVKKPDSTIEKGSMSVSESGPGQSNAASDPESLLDRIDQLSDEQVDSLLEDLLAAEKD